MSWISIITQLKLQQTTPFIISYAPLQMSVLNCSLAVYKIISNKVEWKSAKNQVVILFHVLDEWDVV